MNKTTIRDGCRRLLAVTVPPPIGRAIYSVSLNAVRSRLRLALGPEAPKVWERHEFSLEHFDPFVNALNLTLYFDGRPEPETIRKGLLAWKSMKLLFPMLGSINIYQQSALEHLTAFMNPLEANRDPILKYETGLNWSPPRKADAAVFLLRALEADAIQLMTHPSLKRKKWAYHLKEAGMPFPEKFGMAALVTTAVDLVPGLNSELRRNAVEALIAYFRLGFKGIPYHQTLPNPLLMGLLPHRFVCHSDALEFAPHLVEVVEAQLRWEAWGLGTQLPLATIRDRLGHQFEVHLQKLIAFCVWNSTQLPEVSPVAVEFQRLSVELQRLREFISSI